MATWENIRIAFTLRAPTDAEAAEIATVLGDMDRDARRSEHTLLDTASRVAIAAAGADGATLARLAYQKATKRADKERRVLFPPERWAELEPDHREAVYRVAAAAVEVVSDDAAERVRRTMVEAEAARVVDRGVGRQ